MIPSRLQREKQKHTAERSNKAVAYIRVSFDDQIYGESLTTQKTAIQHYADQNGLEIVKWFEDDGVSGKTIKKREDVKAMLHYLSEHKGEVGYALVYKMQRQSRDVVSWASELKAVLNSLGVLVRSATEPIDETPTGRFMEVVLVANGQLDNDIKSGITKDNMASIAKQGWWQHGPLPGYDIHHTKINAKKSRTTLRPNAKAPAVNQLFELYATGEYSKAEIKRISKELGIRNSRGKWFNDTSIDRLLSQPAMAGYICDKSTDWELYEGQHLKFAIVGLPLFDKVQAVMAQQSRRANKVGKSGANVINSDYPLKGTVRCPNCNQTYRGSAPRSGGGTHTSRYHCSSKQCAGKVKSMKAKVLHQHFTGLLDDITPTVDVLNLYKDILNRQAIKQLGNINSKLHSLNDKVAKLDDERLTVLRNASSGVLTPQEKDDLIFSLSAEKQELKIQVASLEEQQVVRQQNIEYLLNFMHDARKLWVDADFDLKQKFQNMIFPDGLTFDTSTLKFGTSNISALYRYVPNKNDLSAKEKSHLVTPRRVELLLPG